MYQKYEELCKAKNVTSYQVAKETGIAQSTLSDWKSGKSMPKADKLMKIAKYFNVQIEYFLEGGTE